MAITVTQTAQLDANKGGTSTSYTYTVTATAASALLIAAVMDYGTTGGSKVTGITDNKSGGTNTWTQICRGDSATAGGSAIFATGSTAGSITQFTTTLNVAGPLCVQFWEIAGAGAADVNHTNSGSASTISSGSSGTPAGSNDLVIAVGGLFQAVFGPTLSSPAFTTAGGTFVAHDSAGATADAVGYTGRLILSGGSTTAQTFTFSDEGNGATWGACIALWQEAPAFAADGSGTCTADTSTVLWNATGNTVTFTYTAATGGTSSGAITIDIPTGWSAPSVTSSAAGYATATSSGSIGTLSVSGQTITIPTVTLTAGQTVTVVYGSKASSGPGATSTSTTGAATWQVKEKSTSGGTLTNLASSPSIAVVAIFPAGRRILQAVRRAANW